MELSLKNLIALATVLVAFLLTFAAPVANAQSLLSAIQFDDWRYVSAGRSAYAISPAELGAPYNAAVFVIKCERWWDDDPRMYVSYAKHNWHNGSFSPTRFTFGNLAGGRRGSREHHNGRSVRFVGDTVSIFKNLHNQALRHRNGNDNQPFVVSVTTTSGRQVQTRFAMQGAADVLSQMRPYCID